MSNWCLAVLLEHHSEMESLKYKIPQLKGKKVSVNSCLIKINTNGSYTKIFGSTTCRWKDLFSKIMLTELKK